MQLYIKYVYMIFFFLFNLYPYIQSISKICHQILRAYCTHCKDEKCHMGPETHTFSPYNYKYFLFTYFDKNILLKKLLK